MKTLLALMIMLTLAVCIPVPVLANDGDYKNASEWCMANDNLGYSSHGQCVRYVMACYGRGNTGPLCACRDYLNNNPVGFYEEYNNLGECVSHLRHGFVNNN